MAGRKSPGKQEWEALLKQEEKLLKKRRLVRERKWTGRLQDAVPEKLRDTLYKGFGKSFSLVFEKGTGVIEKTYSREKHENMHKLNVDSLRRKEDRKRIRAFSRRAGMVNAKNILISGVEGVGLGALGIGIPDIPLFAGLILKSIYEIALNYGYTYDTEAEQIFILRLIENAMANSSDFEMKNAQLNRELYQGIMPDQEKSGQIKITSQALAEGMITMKFLQGIPIAGIVGGAADTVYLNRITRYAVLKYKRRFLLEKKADL